tara:strand:+ start:950 stop:10414 length:9465 start_codon:yes stop_codon:yes gene_type:complete
MEYPMGIFDEIYGSGNDNSNDYSNLTGSSLVNNQSFIGDVRKYYDSKGESFATTSDMLDNWYTDQRWKDSNFLSAGKDMLEYKNAGDDQALMARLSKAWQNAPERGTFLEQAKDYTLATVFDPINLIPYAGAASKAGRVAKAGRAAGLTKSAAVKRATVEGAKRGALLEGSVGAGMGAGFEALQQSRQMQQGLRDQYDASRIGTAAAIEGVFSGAIGAPLGALASRAPAARALEWKQGTALGDKLDSRIGELSDLERIAQAQSKDDTLPDDVRIDAENDLLDIEKERADVQAAVNKAVGLETELENTAKQLEIAKKEGGNVGAIQASYDTKFREFNDLINKADIEAVERLGNEDIIAKRAEATRAAEEKAKAKADTGTATNATQQSEADAGDTTKAEDPDESATTTGDEAEAEVQADEAPKIPEIIAIPDAKPVKFKKTKAGGWTEQTKKAFDSHVNKVSKANAKNGTDNKPITDEDISKILGQTDGGMKDGKITAAGNQAVKIFIANREGRISAIKSGRGAYVKSLIARNDSTPIRKDEADFTNPSKTEAEKIIEADVPTEKSEISDFADNMFNDILREAGLSPKKMRSVLNGLIRAGAADATPMDEEIVAALRRRIKDFEENTLPTIDAAKSAEEVSRLKAEAATRSNTEDLKFTANRVADRTAKSGEAMEKDALAGRVFREYIDPKTGEKKVNSKLSKWFKRGVPTSDNRTVNEGEGIFRRVNEKRSLAEAEASADAQKGIMKAVYSYSARAGEPVVGIKGGGKGRGGPAAEGQVVHGVWVPRNDSPNRGMFKVYASEDMALKASGLKKAGSLKIIDDNKQGISVKEDFEKLIDQAEKKLEKTGDFDEFDFDVETAKALARKGGLSVDPPAKTKVVDGNGNDVTDVQELPDVPATKDGKKLILLPKTLEQKPRVLTHTGNLEKPGQLERGDGLQKLLGPKGKVENFNIGYVPLEHNGKKVSSATDRDILKVIFEPLDQNNSIGKQAEVTPEPQAKGPSGPLELDDAFGTEIDLKRLSSTPEGKQIVNRLYLGHKFVDGGNFIGNMDEFINSKPTLTDIYTTLQQLEEQQFRVVMDISDTEMEIPFGRRLDAITAFLHVLSKEAPDGIRKPTVDIETSLAQLRKISGNLNDSTFSHIERMMRAIVPDKSAPIFKPINELSVSMLVGKDTAGLYSNRLSANYANVRPVDDNTMDIIDGKLVKGNDANAIFLQEKNLDKLGTKTGINTSFTVMHELGHWAYENLLPYDLKLEFWQSVSKYYDEKGKFDGGFVSDRVDGTLLDAYSPIVREGDKAAGASNAHHNAGELFANQFALWAHHTYEAPLAAKTADGSFFKRAADIVKKLWRHMTNRHIVDPEMETIFNKMIANKDEARRVQFTNPVDANTSLGKSLRVRYDQVRMGRQLFLEGYDGYPEMHDPEKMALGASEIANAFQGMAMTQKERSFAASRQGRIDSSEAQRIANYSGVFRAVGGHQKMRTLSRQINEITVRTSYAVSALGDDFEMGGSVFRPEMAKEIAELWEKNLNKYSTGKLEEINEAYTNVEFGDIPEAMLSDSILSLREQRGITAELMEKQKIFKAVKRATNVQRGNLKSSFNKIMASQAKANKARNGTTVVKGTKGDDTNKYGLIEALAEYRRQIGADGAPSDFGNKLAKRVYHLTNTKINDINLTEDEQAILNTLQSKQKAKGGGNKGRAIDIKQPDIVLGMALSADKEVIKGLGATPEQAMNVLQALIRMRKNQRANKKASKQSDAVGQALTIEQYQDHGTQFENGIPQNANSAFRDYLRGFTHRTPAIENTARTIVARLARLSATSLPATPEVAAYGNFRKIVRAASTNLSRTEDITQAVSFVSEALYSTTVVPHSTRNVFSKAASILGGNPGKLFSDVMVEAVDVNSTKPKLKIMSEIMDGEDADLFADFIDDLENEITEGLAYVLNGTIANPAARERFSPLTVFGDMIGESQVLKGSPKARYSEAVPAEYAVDFANEVTTSFTRPGYDAIREFTGDKVVPHFSGGVSDGPFGIGNYVSVSPRNTVANTRTQIISSVPAEKREAVTDLVDMLQAVRAKINMGKIDGSTSFAHIDRLYTLDDVLSKELEDIGANIDTTSTPVFIRDTQPAMFENKMTGKHAIVKTLISHLKSSETSVNQAQAIDDIRGVYSAEEMVRTLSEILGGERKLKRTLQQAGFTSITLGGDKMMLSSRSIRSVRSDVFENATPILGENARTNSANGRAMLDAMEGANELRIFKQAAQQLEDGGVPPRTLEAMISVARGRGMPSDAAAEIRKCGLFNPIRTNAKIMARSGMRKLAGFFEPEDGSGGHFERTNAQMGKFLIPLTKMLRGLPDSGGVIKRYFQTGPQMMIESAIGAVGISPKRRMSQPNSHVRIISALRNKNKVSSLTQEELVAYTHTRDYLDQANGRLNEAGALVGNIDKNYFPMIWRKDMIENDPEEFMRRMSKYFMAERNGGGSKELADKSARRMMQRIIDEDGVLSNPAQNFKRMTDKAGDSADHLDYNRVIRLDEYTDFADFDTPDSLAVFLENDLLVSMTKYSDNLEHRIDLTTEYGAGMHGYHDYMSILAQPMNARKVIGALLSSDKIISTTWARSGASDHGVKENTFDNNYFYAPIKDKFQSEQKAKELIDMAQGGKTAAEIEANIMDLLGDQLSDNPDAIMLRNNFRKRANAIANALGDTEGLTKLTSNNNLKHAQGFMNAAMRRPIDGVHGLFSGKNASKWLRGVNAVTLLGFTTLTSLGDLILPLIRTGDLGSYAKALRKFSVEPEYRDMIRNIGAATENAVHQRLTVAHGVDSTQFMTGFFNSTLLTPWTDMMRDVAASVSYEHLKSQQKVLRNRPNSRAGRIARRILQEEGLAEFVKDKNLDMDLVMESRFTGAEHPLANKLAASMIKLTNQMIFTPNPNDLPLWGQTPLGAIAMQLKSYPLMMTRLVNTVAGEAFRGDTPAQRGANFVKAFAGQSDNRLGPLAALLVAGPAMGGIAVGTKDIIQGRGGEDNREFGLRERRLSDTLTTAFEENEDLDMLMGWYFDGMVALGGLGLIGELAYDIASQSDNGAYGTQRTLETIGGPTVGLFNDATVVLQGGRSWWDDKPANGERRAAMREIVGRVPVLGGVSWAKEGIVDAVAGTRGKSGQSGGGSFGGGFGGSF